MAGAVAASSNRVRSEQDEYSFVPILSTRVSSTRPSTDYSRMLPAVEIRQWDGWASAFLTGAARCRSVEVGVGAFVD